MPTARARQLRCALKLAVLGKISALRRRLPRGFSPAVVFGFAAGWHFSPDRLTWVVGRSRVVFLRPVYGFPTYYEGSYTWMQAHCSALYGILRLCESPLFDWVHTPSFYVSGP